MSEPDDAERNDAGFHAAPRSDQDHLYDIQIAAPSHAESARTLAHAAHTGASR